MRKYLVSSLLIIAIIMGCDSSDDSNEPSQPSPIASFTTSGTLVTPANVTFTNNSANADQYNWDFGDGRTSIQTNPSMLFDVYGTYQVTLVAIQSSTSRTDTARHNLIITPGTVKLDSIWLEALPFVDGTGVGWDLTSGPDLYFNFTNGTTALLTTPYLLDFAPANLPLAWYFNPEYSVAAWADTFYFDFWDDDDVSDDDYIGSTSFSINRIIATQGYIDSAILENGSGTLRTKLILKWE